jgi:hypothetical protein
MNYVGGVPEIERVDIIVIEKRFIIVYALRHLQKQLSLPEILNI